MNRSTRSCTEWIVEVMMLEIVYEELTKLVRSSMRGLIIENGSDDQVYV